MFLNIFLYFIQRTFFSREVIAFVDGIEAPKVVGQKGQYVVFSFVMNNGSGTTVWNKNVDKTESKIYLNNVRNILK